MPSLQDKHIGPLKSAVDTMFFRMMHLQPFSMSHDECLELVAEPEHIHVLKTASEYADVHAGEGYMTIEVPREIDGITWPAVSLSMRTHESKTPPLRPRRPHWHNHNSVICDKVVTWLHHRLVQGRMAATTKWVMDELACLCTKPEQVRYMYPAIMHLMTIAAVDNRDSDCQRWRERYGTFKAVRACPAVPPHLRKAMIESSTWLTQAAMLDEIQAPPKSATEISLSGMYNAMITDHIVITRD